jgi:hypothetical protein
MLFVVTRIADNCDSRHNTLFFLDGSMLEVRIDALTTTAMYSYKHVTSSRSVL